jgi:hypothetical protein
MAVNIAVVGDPMTMRRAPRSGAAGGTADRPGTDPAQLLRTLEAENAALRDTVAELALQTAILRERLEGE